MSLDCVGFPPNSCNSDGAAAVSGEGNEWTEGPGPIIDNCIISLRESLVRVSQAQRHWKDERGVDRERCISTDEERPPTQR